LIITYVGLSNVRRITTADFVAAGLSQTTLTWDRVNGFSIDVPPEVGAFCIAQGDFVSEPAATFGSVINGVDFTGGKEIFIHAPDLNAMGENPTLGLVAFRWQAWMIDPNTNEQIRSQIKFPVGWTHINIDLFWSNPGSGSGNVKFQLIFTDAANGADLSNDAVVTTQTLAAPSQERLSINRLSSAYAIVADKMYGFRISRSASDAADTLPNDAAILGFLFSRSS
jgi:hypothetical protein